MILKCKMCGGDMECTQGSSVMECPYCGTNQTLPQVDDERIAQMHSRANQLRRLKEFDKAQMIYEEIIAQNPKDAEAHWCALLCRYGIEYVEDPYSREQKPTLHRTQFDAITDDPHYIAVAEYADGVARALYEHEAQMIERIRKRYLSIASKEEPFDVFICYKETDANGQRTHDSVYAQEIYNELTREGYKVFFARITLEDKLGEAYEPYIFAALGSAKVMLVVGTCAAHMQAEWVKNEWKRFLYLMKQDSKKRIIPVYRDMEAYDMPEEFVYMQAQDYSRLGALQDLVRGVEKIVGKKTATKAQTPAQPAQPVQQVVVNQQGAGVESLLRRVFIFLEDENWESADEYCERVLDIDPENARAYLGKLMADLEVCKVEDLRDEEEEFDDHEDCIKAMRFGDAAMKQMLEETNAYICERNEQQRLEELYDNAVKLKDEAKSEGQYLAAAEAFAQVPGYRDADAQQAECVKLAEQAHKDYVYNAANTKRNTATCEEDFIHAAQQFSQISGWRDADQQREECLALAKEAAETSRKDAILYNAVATANNAGRKISEIQKAIDILAEIPGWRDADGLVVKYRKEIEAIETQERELKLKQQKDKKTKRIRLSLLAAAAVACFIVVYVIPSLKYSQAIALREEGQYEQARSAFAELGDFKDSNTQIAATWYEEGTSLRTAAKYSEALVAFKNAGEYSDSKNQVDACYFKIGMKLKNEARYNEAIMHFNLANSYADSASQIQDCWYAIGLNLKQEAKYDEAIAAFEKTDSYSDSAMQIQECWYAIGINLMSEAKYSEALTAFGNAKGHSDSASRIQACWYAVGMNLQTEEKYEEAVAAYLSSNNYSDSRTRIIAIADSYLAAGKPLYAALNYRKAGEYDKADKALRTGTFDYSKDSGAVRVLENGKIEGWTSRLHLGNLSRSSDFVAVSMGCGADIFGLRKNGTVATTYYELGWNNIVEIDAGLYHLVGLKADGTVLTYHDFRDESYYYKDHGQYNVENWADIISVSAGTYHTVGLKKDRTVVAVGHNEYGQCNTHRWRDIAAISAGSYHTVALKKDGTVVAVGANKQGQCNVSGWKNIVQIAAGYSFTIGLKANGTVVFAGEISTLDTERYARTYTSKWKKAVAVAGDDEPCALTSDGEWMLHDSARTTDGMWHEL